MKIIIMGCGRVGSQVSLLLVKHGHEVTVIDHDANALSKLGADFKGRIVRGLGFDRNVLVEAGIESTEGFVAASASDNANIVAARIAHNIFRVPRVVARLYDPVRAEIYQRLGLTTISSTAWGAERIVEVVTHADLDVLHVFQDGGTSMVRVELPSRLNGHRVSQMNIPGEVSVTAITRNDHTFIPVSGTEFLEGDVIYLAVIPTAMVRLEELLGIEEELVMFVLVVGGGNTGSQLAKFLLEAGHTLRVIDERPNVLEKLADELPEAVIINGDGSSPTVLEKAGIQKAQVLAAVTGLDETNLVITSLAKFEFNVPRVIARINNSKNAWLFTPEMGVDVSLNQAEILARLTAEEMSIGDMMTMLKIRRGKYSIVEEKIAPSAPAIGLALKDLSLPNNCIISGIIRHGEMVLPRGTTTLEEGDEILALVDDPAREQLAKLLSRP